MPPFFYNDMDNPSLNRRRSFGNFRFFSSFRKAFKKAELFDFFFFSLSEINRFRF